MQAQYFDKHYEEHILSSVGFALGMIHGAVQLADGTLQKDATTLVRLHDEEIARGYRVGREYFFIEAETDEEWTITDTYLINQLYLLAEEYRLYQNPERTVRYHLGCLLGRMSGHLFPWTRAEQSAYEQECIRILGEPEELRPNCIAARQFVVSNVA